MTQLLAVEAALTISSPVAASIKNAYRYFPANDATPECPCFLNSWTMVDEERAPQQRIQHYTVHMQLFIDDSDHNQAADIATAFHVALVDALDAATSLSGSVVYQQLRGGSPTLATLTRGRDYIGLDLFCELTLKEGKAFSP